MEATEKRVLDVVGRCREGLDWALLNTHNSCKYLIALLYSSRKRLHRHHGQGSLKDATRHIRHGIRYVLRISSLQAHLELDLSQEFTVQTPVPASQRFPKTSSTNLLLH